MQKCLFVPVSKQQYYELIEQNTILEGDTWGVKVLETSDDQIIKIFRLKRLYSTAYFFPYALRFKWNARCLKKKGIETVEVQQISYCQDEQRHLLSYKKIPGQPIEAILKSNQDHTAIIKQLVGFIAYLHEQGIYFRSLHFGNIIVKPDGQFALIDITDTKFNPFKLSLHQRIRNWKHMLKYDFERSIVETYGRDAFFSEYAERAALTAEQLQSLKTALS